MSLKQLWLGGCRAVVGDLSAVAGLVRLEVLQLYKTGVTGDVRHLAGLGRLRDLRLFETRVSGDVSSLRGLKALDSLALSRDCIQYFVSDVFLK